MVRVVEYDEEVVLEDRLRLLEGDAVLIQIVGGLVRVPLESHRVIIGQWALSRAEFRVGF
jgi:predicted ThiF/HesA family dinucleotide-utilizing enzyme